MKTIEEELVETLEIACKFVEAYAFYKSQSKNAGTRKGAHEANKFLANAHNIIAKAKGE